MCKITSSHKSLCNRQDSSLQKLGTLFQRLLPGVDKDIVVSTNQSSRNYLQNRVIVV